VKSESVSPCSESAMVGCRVENAVVAVLRDPFEYFDCGESWFTITILDLQTIKL
jgi:hypothetical protein